MSGLSLESCRDSIGSVKEEDCMRKLGKALVVMASVAAVALPATPAFADDNPCKGQAPGPHCRPPCTFTPRVDPGDPLGGQGPVVYFEQSGC